MLLGLGFGYGLVVLCLLVVLRFVAYFRFGGLVGLRLSVLLGLDGFVGLGWVSWFGFWC